MIPPANPIISKQVDNIDEKISFKLDPLRMLCEQ